MKVFSTLDDISNSNAMSIFLAGPSPRTNSDSWRTEAIDYFKKLNFEGDIFSPSFVDNNKDSSEYSRVVSWETKAMEKASIILFWIPRNETTLPGYTTNIEFGEYLHSGKIVIGAPDGAYKNDYLKVRCNFLNIRWHTNLESLVETAINSSNQKTASKVFFTSDTHYSEKRTMQLSKRPYSTVQEMDWDLLKKFNSKVTNNDIVYHLGDFGDPSFIKHLNGKEFYIVAGNYDQDSVLEALKTDPRVKIIPESFATCLNYDVYSLVHYPTSMIAPKKFYLFGHIHSLQKVRRNGLNVGVDCHNFEPISLDEVEFYKNAIINYYDENVFGKE